MFHARILPVVIHFPSQRVHSSTSQFDVILYSHYLLAEHVIESLSYRCPQIEKHGTTIRRHMARAARSASQRASAPRNSVFNRDSELESPTSSNGTANKTNRMRRHRQLLTISKRSPTFPNVSGGRQFPRARWHFANGIQILSDAMRCLITLHLTPARRLPWQSAPQ